MATLEDVIFVWPIAVNVIQNLSFGDLLKLSRTSTQCRAALHGFGEPNLRIEDEFERKMRDDLYIGQHQTDYWKHLKSATIWECSEPQHTKGSNPRNCRYCSMPVCEACIVKDSIGKSDSTFKNRTRFLCTTCWNTGVPHRGRRFRQNPNARASYNFAPGEGDFCSCTVKDGWVCRSCKIAQNQEAKTLKTCIGENCANDPGEDKDRRRLCLWCDLPMTRGRAPMESRSAYDRRHIHARANELFERQSREEREEYNRRVRDKRPITIQQARDSRRQRREPLEGGSRFAYDFVSDRREHLPHFGAVDYTALGVVAPTRWRVFDSVWGKYRYDEDFLMQFQTRCIQSPVPDWGQRMINVMVDENPESPVSNDDEEMTDHGGDSNAIRQVEAPQASDLTMNDYAISAALNELDEAYVDDLLLGEATSEAKAYIDSIKSEIRRQQALKLTESSGEQKQSHHTRSKSNDKQKQAEAALSSKLGSSSPVQEESNKGLAGALDARGRGSLVTRPEEPPPTFEEAMHSGPSRNRFVLSVTKSSSKPTAEAQNKREMHHGSEDFDEIEGHLSGQEDSDFESLDEEDSDFMEVDREAGTASEEANDTHRKHDKGKGRSQGDDLYDDSDDNLGRRS